jgi:hypothetical protein
MVVKQPESNPPMTNRLPQPPDAMPLREALRAMRHMLRKGGETLIDTIPVADLPVPGLAGAVLHQVGALARGVDHVTSGMAKLVLGASEQRGLSLPGIAGQAAPDAAFAAGCYAALRAVLQHLGVAGVFLSEATVKQSYRAVMADHADDAEPLLAARLTLALLKGHVIRGVTAADAAYVPGGALDQVAIFAVMLWLQTDRPDGEDGAALEAAADMALALSAEIARACGSETPLPLSTLFKEFAPRV